MIINEKSAKYHYEGTIYTIGAHVVATKGSILEGLYGTIAEIRDGDDRIEVTGTPEIICSFITPVQPDEINQLVTRLSLQNHRPMTLEMIALDCVCMAPDDIRILDHGANQHKITIYILQEDWACDGDCGTVSTVYTDCDSAKLAFTNLIHQERIDGMTSRWMDRYDFEQEITCDFFECYLYGEYDKNHLRICIEKSELPLGDEVFALIGKSYVESQFRQQFRDQTEDWDELESLTDSQISEMVNHPMVPEIIRKYHSESGYLIDAYWESLSAAAFVIVQKYIEEVKGVSASQASENSNSYIISEDFA